MTAGPLALWVLGAVVGLGVGTVLFRMGCALADVREPGYGKSLLVAGLALVVCVPLGALLVYLAGSYEPDPGAGFGAARIVATVLAVIAGWVLAAGLYALFLAASYRKGLLIAGVEISLSALFSVLLAAVVLVVLALVQITRRPEPGPRADRAPPAARAVAPTAPS